MHMALATSTSEPAFKADLARPADWERWTDNVEDTANQVVRALATRHHGDYHLGQVLVSGEEDVTLVDFEGEPLRDLGERRAKHIPLPDVAGRLRSFSYVAAVAERELPATLAEPHRKGAIARLKEWVETSSSTFLDTSAIGEREAE
jgi:maltose alpha-D-glucosyltransferase / alpha-amylase